MLECEDDIHVIPKGEDKPHVESPECWCEPELHYRDEDTEICVWEHRRVQ
jgi:hypothetical protein